MQKDEKFINNKDKYSNFLKKIDNVELIPDEQMENMDFYELAYYLQTLNQIKETFTQNNEEGENNNE